MSKFTKDSVLQDVENTQLFLKSAKAEKVEISVLPGTVLQMPGLPSGHWKTENSFLKQRLCYIVGLLYHYPVSCGLKDLLLF